MHKKVIAFGEIMVRFSPPDFQKISQSKSMNLQVGGGEANVLISLANFGIPVEYITRLPENPLGDLCIRELRKYGVGVENILRGGERLGLYFLETGASQRASKVTYDRAHSSISIVHSGLFEWHHIFKDARYFHITGITPAISAGAAEVCVEAVQYAREYNISVSCDLNYRKNLWKWGGSPRDIMTDILQYCSILVANEEDANSYFGIKPPRSNLQKGTINIDEYQLVCQNLLEIFPNLKVVAITLRSSISASHNLWSGVLYTGDHFFKGPLYDIDHIVDRVGSGDSFVGGLLYGVQAYPGDWQKILNFAVTASCLKHSIVGDFNLISVKEVENVMAGDTSGRVLR